MPEPRFGHPDRRTVVAAAGALCATLVMIGLAYLLVAVWWRSLPVWLALPLCLLLAVAAVGSPIYTLLRFSQRSLQRRLQRSPGSDAVRDR